MAGDPQEDILLCPQSRPSGHSQGLSDPSQVESLTHGCLFSTGWAYREAEYEVQDVPWRRLGGPDPSQEDTVGCDIDMRKSMGWSMSGIAIIGGISRERLNLVSLKV